LTIGGDLNFSEYWPGKIDEVRIWNVARSPAEIQTYFDRSLHGSESGLVAYWRFDEGNGNIATDFTGNGHTGTLINSPTWMISPVVPPTLPQNTPATFPDLKLSRAGLVRAIVEQHDGKIIIGGIFASVNDVPRTNLARLNPNGTVDLTWDPQGLPGEIHALALDATDLFIGGSELQKRNLGTGARDETWQPGFAGTALAMAIQGTDLYVGGSLLNKLSTVGSGFIDPSWNPNPTSTNGFVLIKAILVNGTNVFIAGIFDSIGGVNRPALAKLSAQTGLADPAWGVSFGATSQSSISVHSMAVSGTNLFVGGDFQQIGGLDIRYAAKLAITGSGAVDPDWNPNPYSLVTSPIVASSNYVYISGFNPCNECASGKLFRVSTSGTGALDPSWHVEVRPDAYGNSIFAVLLTESSLLVGSDMATINGEVSLGIMKLNRITGARDPGFAAQVQSPGIVRAMARQADGKVIIGGDFWFISGLPRQSLARVNQDGTLDRTWAPNANDRVHAIVLNGNDAYVGGRFTKVGRIQRHAIAKIATQGSDAVDTNWNASANATVGIYGVMALALNGTNLFAVGSFSELGGTSSNGLAKLSIGGSGAADPVWRPNISPTRYDFQSPLALAVGGTNLFVGGAFETVNGVSRRNIAKLTTTGTGTVDSAWNPQILGASDYFSYIPVSSLLLDGTNLYVGGSFTNLGGQPRNGLARLSTQGNGQVDPIWNPSGAGPFVGLDGFNSLARVGNSLVVGGWFSRVIGGAFRANIAMVGIDGIGDVDLSFDPGPVGTSELPTGAFPSQGFNTVVRTFILNGRDLYLGGGFTSIGGTTRSGFAFLPVADAPILIQDTQTDLFVLRNAQDGPEITHFRITAIAGGPLYKSDGVTAISVGNFITVDEGAAGLKFVLGGTLTVVSALNATPGGAGAASASLTMVANPPPLLAFGAINYSVREGQGNVVVIVRKYGEGPATVNYTTSNLTATGGLDYQSRTGTLNFSSTDKLKNIIIAIADDLEVEGDEQFAVDLSNPGPGATLAGPTFSTVGILDNDGAGFSDSFTSTVLPGASGPATGLLSVSLQPSEANGQWRLVGELNWHNSGTIVSGMVSGNYSVEFRPVNGYFPPSASPITVPISAGMTNQFTYFYAATAQPDTGTLSVRIEPSEIASSTDSAMRGQWRRQGTTDWMNNGEMVPNLRAGSYAVEFKPVPGHATPLPQLVQVGGADAIYSGVGTYFFASAPGAAIPAVVPFGTATTNAPYLYNGQLQTSVGFGSGFVVKQRVVLTAAHVLFDDALLTYTSDARWFFQRYRDQLEPVPQVPRGWYIFGGYASQRQLDSSPGISTPASQNLDVAALYFLEDAGRGGYGGYLSSDADNNEYLLGSNNKFLAGYPLEGAALEDQGKLFATVPANINFTRLYTSIFATTNIQSFPGNSGGPLYVQADVDKYLPAALILGGSGQTLVRAINGEVVDLINRAEISGNGGGNISGGGVAILGSGLSAPAFGTGQLTVSMNSASATGIRPGWRVVGSPDTNYLTGTQSTVALFGGGSYPIEFRVVPGFITPSNRTIQMAVSGNVTLQADYVAIRPLLSLNRASGLSLSGGTGAIYRVEFVTNLIPTASWIPFTNFMLSSDPQTISNTRPATNGTRFYRAVLVP